MKAEPVALQHDGFSVLMDKSDAQDVVNSIHELEEKGTIISWSLAAIRDALEEQGVHRDRWYE